MALIQNISVSEDDSQFFVLANKKEQKLGYYLLIVRLDNPSAKSEYLIAWENKLDIGNCDVAMLVETDANGQRSESVVVSYKCIGINTFNVFVFDLRTKLIRYWHESFQLWESTVKGFLLQTDDFLIISKLGINVLALG